MNVAEGLPGHMVLAAEDALTHAATSAAPADGADADAVPSFPVTVQHKELDPYTVWIPRRLCDPGSSSSDLMAIMALVRKGHPHASTVLPSLQPFTFESALWTPRNICSLPDHNYILLAEAASSLPVQRCVRWRGLPSTKVLTEPMPMPEHDGHLPPIFASPCEFLDNSLRALRGQTMECPKKILAKFNLESQAQAASSSHAQPGTYKDQDFIAFLDTGCGMSLQTQKHWARIWTKPQKDAEKPVGVKPYFADGNLSCFGVGSKAAALSFGQEVLLITKVKGSGLVAELRCNKDEIDRQESSAEGAFFFSTKTRHPGTDGDCRTQQELANPRLMELIRKADQEEHFTLFIITDLNGRYVHQLTSEPFQTLVKVLKGMYFYYVVPGYRAATEGQNEVKARANFMHGEGYTEGPVDIEIQGTGFTSEGLAGDDARSSLQTHRLGELPWESWPEPMPDSVEEGGFEDSMHALARVTNALTFRTPLQGVAAGQDTGNKFPFGMIIKGGLNRDNSTVKDVFVLGYLHYLPFTEGRYSKGDLRIKHGVRWFSHWKGRAISFADITAMLGFMKTSMHGEKKEYREQVEDRVVGQLFFQEVTSVDRNKTRFNEAISQKLELLNDEECWYQVDESKLYNNTAWEGYVPAVGLTRDSGVKHVRGVQLATHFKKWVKKCSMEFDQQFELGDEDPERSKEGEYKAFKTLKAMHLPHTFRDQDVVCVPDVTGGKLSWYKSNGSATPARQQTLFGRILYFKRNDGSPDCSKQAVMTREPTKHFGTEEFEFDVYKLTAPDDRKRESEYDRVNDSVPSEIEVVFDTSMRARSKRPIRVPAQRGLPQATVQVFNRLGESVIEWTVATAHRTKRDATKPLIVKQHIVGGDDLNRAYEKVHTAEYVETDQGHFVFSKADPITLPRPGRFETFFTATTDLKGVTAQVIKSPSYYYQADCGIVSTCKMINVPKAATQLRSQLPAMHVELCDDLGNLYKSTSVPQLKFSCEKLNVVPAPGESACWQELQLGEHQLQLPALDITPVRERLIFESPNKPNKPVMCSVVLQISGLPDQQGGTHQVTTTFSIGVLPGCPASLCFDPASPYFSTAASELTLQLENRCLCEPFTMQLMDADGYSAVPLAKKEMVTIRGSFVPSGSADEVPFEFARAELNSTGKAKFKGVKCKLQGISQVTLVRFRAACSNNSVAALECSALVMPWSKPSVMNIFLDQDQNQSLPQDPAQRFLLHQEAGTGVEELYVMFNNEARDLAQLPPVTRVKLNKRVLDTIFQEGCCLYIHAGSSLKSPSATDDSPKEVDLEVSGEDWTCKGTIALVSLPGPGQGWKLDLADTVGSHIVENNSDIGDRIVAFVTDGQNNWRQGLPHDIDLAQHCPQLTVHIPDPHTQQTARFVVGKSEELQHVYGGRWQVKDGMLHMPDLAVLGPPGPIHLTLSGGTTDEGKAFAPDVLSLELQQGQPMVAGVIGWPEGDQPSHVAVEDMSLSFYDAARCLCDLPRGNLVVKISSSTTARAVSVPDQSESLSVTRAHQRLIIAPFRLISVQPGFHTWQLELWADGTKMPDCPLGGFTMAPSARIVRSVDLVSVTSTTVVAGSMPTYKIRLGVEDGTQYMNAQELINNVTAVCSCVDPVNGLTHTMTWRSDEQDASVLVCEPPEGDVCTSSGTYQVVVTYMEAQARALGLGPDEVTPPPLTQTFTVEADTVNKLHLPPAVMAHRTVLNAGSVARRTIVPATTLTIVDRHLNRKPLPGDKRIFTVKLQLQQQVAGQEDWTDVPDLQLDTASSHPPLPLASGQVKFGPITVQQGSGSREGRYGLRVSVTKEAPELQLRPLRIFFDIANASATSEALQNATDMVNSANARVKALEKQLKPMNKSLKQQEAAVTRRVLSERKHLPDGVQLTVDNSSAVLQECQQRIAAGPDQRQPGHPVQPTQAQRQLLLAIPGVVGFLSDLVLVTDDDDARLLSFSAGARLQTLVVRDWQVRLEIRQQLQHSSYKPMILPLTLATALPPLTVPALGPQQAAVTSNPAFFTTLVTARVDAATFPAADANQMREIEGKVIYYACGRLLRMDTESAGAAHMQAWKEAKLSCPDIICRDNGSLIASSGVVSDNDGYIAPQTLAALPHGFFGSLPKQQRPEHQLLQAAVTGLTPLAALVKDLQAAQVDCKATQDELDQAKLGLAGHRSEQEKAKVEHTRVQQLAGMSDASSTSVAGAQGMQEDTVTAPESDRHHSRTTGRKRTRAEQASPTLPTPTRTGSKRRAPRS